jgi:hypothetical protein
MTANWHAVPHDPAIATAIQASVHARLLEVEHRPDQVGWRWVVRSSRGRELASGVACDERTAERAAEDEAYRIHIPVGDPFDWWQDE